MYTTCGLIDLYTYNLLLHTQKHVIGDWGYLSKLGRKLRRPGLAAADFDCELWCIAERHPEPLLWWLVFVWLPIKYASPFEVSGRGWGSWRTNCWTIASSFDPSSFPWILDNCTTIERCQQASRSTCVSLIARCLQRALRIAQTAMPGRCLKPVVVSFWRAGGWEACCFLHFFQLASFWKAGGWEAWCFSLVFSTSFVLKSWRLGSLLFFSLFCFEKLVAGKPSLAGGSNWHQHLLLLAIVARAAPAHDLPGLGGSRIHHPRQFLLRRRAEELHRCPGDGSMAGRISDPLSHLGRFDLRFLGVEIHLLVFSFISKSWILKWLWMYGLKNRYPKHSQSCPIQALVIQIRWCWQMQPSMMGASRRHASTWASRAAAKRTSRHPSTLACSWWSPVCWICGKHVRVRCKTKFQSTKLSQTRVIFQLVLLSPSSSFAAWSMVAWSCHATCAQSSSQTQFEGQNGGKSLVSLTGASQLQLQGMQLMLGLRPLMSQPTSSKLAFPGNPSLQMSRVTRQAGIRNTTGKWKGNASGALSWRPTLSKHLLMAKMKLPSTCCLWRQVKTTPSRRMMCFWPTGRGHGCLMAKRMPTWRRTKVASRECFASLLPMRPWLSWRLVWLAVWI